MNSPTRRLEIAVFGLTLFGFAYFHQGGGWNQNARFALVRAIVDGGTLFIDSYLVYEGTRGTDDRADLVRSPVRDATFERNGTRYALAWRNPRGELVPIDTARASGATLVSADHVAASGDVSYYAGHFHPAKAPGASLLAVPGYAVIRGLEGLAGLPPDRWGVLTINAWLVSVLSVGLVSALGAVLVLRLASALAPVREAALTALVFAFGTMMWPHATLLFEHNIVAAALLAAFYGIERARQGGPRAGRLSQRTRYSGGLLACAGLCAGYAAICNYAMAVLVLVFWGYAILRHGWWPASLWFGLGVMGPLLLLCGYHQICFGTPFTTNYAYENPMFISEHHLLGVFAVPRVDVALTLLFSPFRGLFFTSPVLLLGVAGLVAMLRDRGPKEWGWLIALVAGFLLLLNASFNGWDGGWTAVPRYLGPAMPFLALPIATAWNRWFRTTSLLAIVSIAIQLLLTAVDPQVPIGDVAAAGVPPRAIWRVDPLARYVLPLFVRGRAWPMLDEQIERAVRQSGSRGLARDAPAAEVERYNARLRHALRARVERGDTTLSPLAAVEGPVSVNPIGIYEGGYYRAFPAKSHAVAYNSFNVGEMLFPRSRLSLLPLLVVSALAAASLVKIAAARPPP